MAAITTPTIDERTRTTDTEGAAERLGIQAGTLRNWRWRGDGPRFVKVGRAIRYRLIDLDEWLEARVRTSTSDVGPDDE